jgi:hypothetical protein
MQRRYDTARRHTTKLPRRQFLQLAASAAALPAVSPMGWAQAYPSPYHDGRGGHGGRGPGCSRPRRCRGEERFPTF